MGRSAPKPKKPKPTPGASPPDPAATPRQASPWLEYVKPFLKPVSIALIAVLFAAWLASFWRLPADVSIDAYVSSLAFRLPAKSFANLDQFEGPTVILNGFSQLRFNPADANTGGNADSSPKGDWTCRPSSTDTEAQITSEPSKPVRVSSLLVSGWVVFAVSGDSFSLSVTDASASQGGALNLPSDFELKASGCDTPWPLPDGKAKRFHDIKNTEMSFRDSSGPFQLFLAQPRPNTSAVEREIPVDRVHFTGVSRKGDAEKSSIVGKTTITFLGLEKKPVELRTRNRLIMEGLQKSFLQEAKVQAAAPGVCPEPCLYVKLRGTASKLESDRESKSTDERPTALEVLWSRFLSGGLGEFMREIGILKK